MLGRLSDEERRLPDLEWPYEKLRTLRPLERNPQGKRDGKKEPSAMVVASENRFMLVFCPDDLERVRIECPQEQKPDWETVLESREARVVLVYLATRVGENLKVSEMAAALFGSADSAPASRGLGVIRRAIEPKSDTREAIWMATMLLNHVKALRLEKVDKFRVLLTVGPNGTIEKLLPAEWDQRYGASTKRRALETAPNTTPSKPSANFTGHEDEYNALVKSLAVGDAALTQPAALKGMGGVGKTQLALKFAAEHKEQFPGGIFWIPAETADGAQQKLLEYAARFAPEVIVEQQPETTALRFCDWLAAQGKFLAIFDNTDDFEPTKHYAEVLRKSGRLLYTTRAQHLPAYVADIAVKTLPKELGGQLLLKCMQLPFPSEERASGRGVGGEVDAALLTEVEALSERLGGLPLAIDQAGAYLKQTGRSIAWYAEQYEAKGKLLREKYGATGQSAEHASVATTFSLALESLEEKSPASADLMRVLAFLNPESILESMFAAGAEYLGERLGPLAKEEIEWDSVVEAARQLSLLERSEPPGYLSLHRVVQDVVKDILDEQRKLTWVTAAVGAVGSSTPDIGSIAWWQPLEISAQWKTVIDEALALFIKTIEFSYILNAFATWRQFRGVYAETIAYFQKSLEIEEKIYGVEHPSVATRLNNMALFLETTGRYQEAEPLFRRALEIYETIHGTEHPAVATNLNNLAGFLETTGRYQEAEPLYRRELEIYKTIHGTEHPAVATSLNDLAGFLETTGRFQEAEPLYKRALEIYKTIHGMEHPAVATSLNNFALFLETTGKYQEAEPLYRKALEIYEAIYGTEHPAVAQSFNNLAYLLQTTERYYEAEPLYRKALEIREAQLDAEHPNIAQNLNDLAGLLQTTGRYLEAEPLYRRALEIYEAIHDTEHPDVATSLNNLAGLLQKTGQYQEAEQFSQRAFLIILPVLGEVHPNTKIVAQVWLSCLQSTHKNQVALTSEVPQKLYEQALMIVNQGTEKAISPTS